jgi:hypothetical protein
MLNYFEILQSPKNKSKLIRWDSEALYFQDGDKYPVVRGTPIMIDEENSLFSFDEIIKLKDTTQSKTYNNQNNLKNKIRKNILPSLSEDRYINERYKKVFHNIAGKNVLVIGAGDKVSYYKKIFEKASILVISDVHGQFGADIILDAHQIPFKNESFDIILAGQVLEHCIQPWQVADEIQRVAKLGAIIQVETPFNFPYHAPPFDFFRFTFTGLRSLFNRCQLADYTITEGNWSTVAVFLSNSFLVATSNKLLRRSILVITRLMLGWLKFLEKKYSKDIINKRDISMPQGFAMTFVYDKIKRSEKELLSEYFNISQ